MSLEKVIEAVKDHEEKIKNSNMRRFFPNFDPFVSRDGAVWIDMYYALEIEKDVRSKDLPAFVKALEEIVTMLKPIAIRQTGGVPVVRYVNVVKADGDYLYHDHDTVEEALEFDEETWCDGEVVSRAEPVVMEGIK